MGNKAIDKTINFVAWLIGVITALGIGGLFVAGTFRSVVLLKFLPLVAHQVVGWLIIASTLLGLLMLLVKKIA